MKATRLAACSVIAVMASFGAQAQELPSWNPSTICVEDSTPDHCVFLERQARGQLSQQWNFIPSLVREQCLTRAADSGTQSWRIFGECFAEAARAPSGGASAAAAVTTTEGSSSEAPDTSAIEAELEAAKARIAELEAQSGDQGDDSEADAKIAELTAELEKATMSARSGEVRISGLQQRLLASIEGSDESAEALQADLDKAISRARASEFRAKSLETTLRETIALSKAAKSESEASAMRLAELESPASEGGDSGGADVSALQADLDKAISRARAAEFRSKSLETTLRETLAASKASSEADNEAAAKVADLQGELDKAKMSARSGEVRIEGLQKRLLGMITAADEAESAEEAEVSAEVADLQAALDKSQSNVQAAQSRIRGLQDRLIEMNKASAEAADAAKSETNERITELEAALAKAETSARSSTVRIEGLQQRLLAATDAATGDTSVAEEAEARISELETELDKTKTAARSSEVRIEGLQKRLLAALDASENVAEAVGSPDENAAKAERLERQLELQRERMARVGARVAEQRGQIETLEGEIRTLRRAAETSGVEVCQQRMSEIAGSGGIQFDNEKADIRDDAAQVLDRLIAVAQSCERTLITLKGHTDSRGERFYIQDLSQRRANAVVRYMSANGIAPSRLNAIGVGPDEPIADNNTRAGRSQNRRIEFLVN